MKHITFWFINLTIVFGQAPQALNDQVDQIADRIESKVIEWRRDFHQNPELSNREFRTAEKVAEHLKVFGNGSSNWSSAHGSSRSIKRRSSR